MCGYHRKKKITTKFTIHFQNKRYNSGNLPLCNTKLGFQLTLSIMTKCTSIKIWNDKGILGLFDKSSKMHSMEFIV